MKQQILTGLLLLLASIAASADPMIYGDVVRREELMIVKGYITCSAHALNADKPDPKQIVFASYKLAEQVEKYFSISGTINGHQFDIRGNMDDGSVSLSMMNDVPIVDGVLPPDRFTTNSRFGPEETSNVDLTIVRDRVAMSFGCTRRLVAKK